MCELFRLYLDEVGTDDLSHIEQDNHRFLSLTGVIIELAQVNSFLNPSLRNLKQEVFESDPDEIIHLHRSDIVRRKSVFGQLNENARREKFNQMITAVIQDTSYTVVTVLIDKLELSRRLHWDRRHPYHYLMEIMVEKYTQFLERRQDIGDIMPEARKGKKDRLLQDEFERVRRDGTRYLSVDRIESRIRSKNLKFRTKKDNISGLQLCDLIAHPSHMHIRDTLGHNVGLGEFATSVRDVLVDSKYDRSRTGNINGYGIKVCP